MAEDPKFNIEEIIHNYAPPSPDVKDTRYKSTASLIRQEDFINEANVFALVGTGGTLSSGYSPREETIVPGKYRAAEYVINDLKQKFRLISDHFSSIDIFAKDSRDIVNEDLILFLDILHHIKNERILVVSGTYMLPLVTELLMRTNIDPSKTIGVTGAMLPSGFMLSDAPINIMSTVTAINQRHVLKDSKASNIMAVFHGQVYDTREQVCELDLHPKETDSLVIGYPHISAPASQ